MRLLVQALPLLCAALLLPPSPVLARRVRVRPSRPAAAAAADNDADQEPNPQQLRYYAAQPTASTAADADDAQQGYLVSSDPYNGLYGRPTARAQTDVSEAQIRSALASSRAYSAAAAAAQAAASRPRVKESSKQPPVQTLRNYSKVNDDGSFTFGYEAADGSFKEETRGTDCVVRGKYGYIDPDGNKREFTYVSGNPCDPNAVQEEEVERDAEPDSGEENVPKAPLRPLRPVRPVRPIAASRPATTVFEQSYAADDDGLDDAPQRLFTPTPRPRLIQPTPSPTPAYTSYTSAAQQPVRITPRPPTPTTPRSQLPATTYRPQLLQLAVTPRPGVVYTQPAAPARATPAPAYATSTGSINFDEELRKFQIDNNVLTTPAPVRSKVAQQAARPAAQPVRSSQPAQAPRKIPSTDPIYTSELVFDPSTGQYNTVLYQQLPQTQGELNLRHRLQPYVHQPFQQQPQPQPQQQYQPQSQYYQQQQAALLAQSQQLFAQQQQQRAVAQQQRYLQAQTTTPRAPAPAPAPAAPQRYAPAPQPQAHAQFFYVSPSTSGSQQNQLAQGQIEAFLRGHNIAF